MVGSRLEALNLEGNSGGLQGAAAAGKWLSDHAASGTLSRQDLTTHAQSGFREEYIMASMPAKVWTMQ